MDRQSGRVIYLDEVRRQREEQRRQKAQEVPLVVVFYPVWFWVPFWPAP
jgi:hypothetical protein